MKKILPRSAPIFTSYPRHANLVSILSHHKSFKKWLFMNHIQFHSEYNREAFYTGFYEPVPRMLYQLVDTQKIRKDVIEKNGIDVVTFLKNAIEENYYIYMCVDTFYISEYPLCNRSHFTHDMFVFGYDDSQSCFHIADFLHEGRYYDTQIPYEQLKVAFHSEYDFTNDFNGIQLLKVKEEEDYPFDIDWIIRMLEDYASGFDTSRRFLTLGDPYVERVYGFGVYEEVIKFMHKTTNHYSVIRALHVMSDHKKLMKLRVEYLLEHRYMTNADLLAESHEIEKSALVIRNSFIKYSVLPTKEKLEHITDLIRNLRDKEVPFISGLIGALKSNRNS